jgi:hypothetical protein
MAFRGLVLSHPVGNTSGRMTVLSGITDGLVWCYLCRVVLYFRYVSNSELFTFMQKTWFVIMNLWMVLCNNLWLVYLWTRLRVSLLYKCRSCDVSDLPGATRQRQQVTSILLLNGQEDWFRQWYGINLRGSVTSVSPPPLPHWYPAILLAAMVPHLPSSTRP